MKQLLELLSIINNQLRLSAHMKLIAYNQELIMIRLDFFY